MRPANSDNLKSISEDTAILSKRLKWARDGVDAAFKKLTHKISGFHPAFADFLGTYYEALRLKKYIAIETEAQLRYQHELDKADQACRYAYALTLWNRVDAEVQLARLPKSGITDSQLQKVLNTTEKAGWRPDEKPPEGVSIK